MAERFSPRRISMRAQREARELARVARDIPYQVHDILDELRDGELKVKISNPGIDDLAHHIDVSVNRIAVALVILGGLVGSSLIGVLAEDGPHVIGLHLLSVVGFVISGVFGVWLLWGIFKHGALGGLAGTPRRSRSRGDAATERGATRRRRRRSGLGGGRRRLPRRGHRARRRRGRAAAWAGRAGAHQRRARTS